MSAARFSRGTVATPHYLASAAGAEVLARGGNAVDAVVAANLALGVVAPYYCGYGGDLLALVWDGAVHGYLGVGRAGAEATIERVAADAGHQMPVLGPHAVTVPGAIAGWFDLLERWGTLSFGDLATEALRLARDGFPVTRAGARRFGGCAALYRGFDDLLSAYAGARAEGAVLRQPALASTIERLAADGRGAYYGGPIGAAIAATVQERGGGLTVGDLADHAGAWAEPLRASYRGVEVLELPPPTQGVAALEALRILEGLDLGGDGADRHHLMIEAVKAALADRDAHVGDPRTMRVGPDDLLGASWVDQRRAAIDPERAATPAPAPGPDGGTAYLCAADGDGLLVSLIQSNFLAMGSGVRVEEWGINLQNRGSSFRLETGHPNALAPGKLPMHTLIPALALRDGRPWLVFGSMGGHGQAQTHVQILTRILLDRTDPQEAVGAPRWAVEPSDWSVAAEPRFDPSVLDGLRTRGHRVHLTRPFDDHLGHAHVIEIDGAGFRVGTDPRAEGAALGR